MLSAGLPDKRSPSLALSLALLLNLCNCLALPRQAVLKAALVSCRSLSELLLKLFVQLLFCRAHR